MFDIAKAVKKTKRAKEKDIKDAVRIIKQYIEDEIKKGQTFVWVGLGKNSIKNADRIKKYFEDKGFMVSNYDYGRTIDMKISWDYVED